MVGFFSSWVRTFHQDAMTIDSLAVTSCSLQLYAPTADVVGKRHRKDNEAFKPKAFLANRHSLTRPTTRLGNTRAGPLDALRILVSPPRLTQTQVM